MAILRQELPKLVRRMQGDMKKSRFFSQHHELSQKRYKIEQ